MSERSHRVHTADCVYLALFIVFVPISFFVRFSNLSAVLFDPHPWRQGQTALTIQTFYQFGINLLDYRSPFNGALWNFVFECPLYQAMVTGVMHLGLGLETASRIVTIFSFSIGALSLFWIARKWFGTRIAKWAFLFYLINPYTVIYSRTCLIDFTALAFLLLSYVCLIWAREKNGAMFFFGLAFGTVFGLLAALTKVTVWYVPGALSFVFLAVHLWKTKFSRRQDIYILCSLGLQLVGAVAWVLWANKIRGEAGQFIVLSGWFFGAFESRLRWESWKFIVRPIARMILHDTLVIPFVIGTALCFQQKWRTPISYLLGLIFLPILVKFHIYEMHDYYLMAQVPFIIMIAALGFEAVFRMDSISKKGMLLAMGVIFLHRVENLHSNYTTVFHDWRSKLALSEKIKRVSDPIDIIYYEEDQFRDLTTFYTDRFMHTNQLYDFGDLNPSVIHFNNWEKSSSLIQGLTKVWVTPLTTDFYVLRSREVGEFKFDPKIHIAALKRDTSSSVVKMGLEPLKVDLCRKSADHALIAVKNFEEIIVVSALETGNKFYFSKFNYVSLPRDSIFGCQFVVSTQPQSLS